MRHSIGIWCECQLIPLKCDPGQVTRLQAIGPVLICNTDNDDRECLLAAPQCSKCSESTYCYQPVRQHAIVLSPLYRKGHFLKRVLSPNAEQKATVFASPVPFHFLLAIAHPLPLSKQLFAHECPGLSPNAAGGLTKDKLSRFSLKWDARARGVSCSYTKPRAPVALSFPKPGISAVFSATPVTRHPFTKFNFCFNGHILVCCIELK